MTSFLYIHSIGAVFVCISFHASICVNCMQTAALHCNLYLWIGPKISVVPNPCTMIVSKIDGIPGNGRSVVNGFRIESFILFSDENVFAGLPVKEELHSPSLHIIS